MTEYQCGNCREFSRLGPSARFCPYCGSSSLNLIIKEGPDEIRKAALDLHDAGVALGIEIGRSMEEKKPRRRKLEFDPDPDLASLKPTEEKKPRRH